MNEISIVHIVHLSDIKLSEMLHALLKIEASMNRLVDYEITVPLKITVADGGEDGRILWNGNPKSTQWLKNKLTIFQNKATNLIPSNCFEEILETEIPNKPRSLKSQIEEVVINNGCYILFTTQDLNKKQKNDRIVEFRRAIQEAGHANYATFQIEIYDANEIKDWVNNYISVVALVQSFNGIHRPQGFVVWEKWEILSKSSENKFQTDTIINENISLIQKTIKNEKVLRIFGHSGLGKTRLVLESFRNFDLRESIVYYNLEGNINISEIYNYILSYQETQNGIIIIDNCDSSNHVVLSRISKPIGNIKIITIGLDDFNSKEDLQIKIEREKQREIVKEIIQDKIGGTHQQSDVEYVNTISEGYPSMAIIFCDVILKEGISELHKIPLGEFTKKLIFGQNTIDDIEYDIIRSCSVFSVFGFLDDSFIDVINQELKDSLKAQMKFIRTRIYDGELTETKFKETCNKFRNKDIIEKRGVFYIVKPTILAINLAADWLMNTDSDRIIEIIKDLKQVNLEEKFAERLKDLDQIDKAKDIVKELWGPNSPFSTAEVLNTSWGSLLFRYVVEVNPIETARALEISFGKMSKEEIYKIDNGRRNLVWALEKLCFREQTFNIAAKILYSFAVSENETWSNNATFQFKQLFQLFLSGTQATLMERLDIIKWGLNKHDDDYTKIAIHALGRSLINADYSRTGGAEKQGSSAPLEDNRPNWNDIYNYWIEIIPILTELACSDNQHSDFAKEKIAHSIRFLLRDHEKNIIKSIRKIIKAKGNLWIEALNNLKMTLNYEKNLPQDIIDEINLLILELTPKDIKNQLFLKVTKPEWNSYEKDINGSYLDKPKIIAEEFAQELTNLDISWIEYVKDLLQGEQRQGFNFGVRIGELITDIEDLIDITIKYIKEINIDKRNPELIAGMLYGAKNEELSHRMIDKFISDDELNIHAFYITRVLYLNYNDIDKLFVLVDKYGFSINQFQNFQYGRALDKLKNEEVLLLCDKISKYDKIGKWTALSLLFMFCYNDDKKLQIYKDFLKNLIGTSNMIIENEENYRLESYHWSDTIIKILTKDTENEFAITITNQIIEFCSQTHFNYAFDVDVTNVISILFDKYFEITWEYFGKAIIGDYFTYYHLKNMIGSRNDYMNNREGIAFQNSGKNNIILEWCRNQSDKAPRRIANMMPLSIKENDEIKWHPFSKAIIDEFGDDENVLKDLSANMGTFGTIGSSIPYYKVQKKLLQDLISHKNPNVKEWAIRMIESTEKTIKIEKLNDEIDLIT